MSYTGQGYTPNPQYGTTNNQFATTYTPVNQSQNQYGIPPYNPYSSPYQQNSTQFPFNQPYAQNNFFNPHGQSNTTGVTSYPPNGSTMQEPNSKQRGQYSNVAPPNNSDGSKSTSNESYNEVPPPSCNPAPPPSFNQASPPSYNQAPPPSYNQAPPPSYNQRQPPSDVEKTSNYWQGSSYQQGPAYSQGVTYPQQGITYPQQSQSYTSNEPNYPEANPYSQNKTSHPPTYGPIIGPQKPPKRPHMPYKLQTSFKQAKKTTVQAPKPITSMKPLQGGKSAANTIHEIAQQNGWTINWFEESEAGPAHAKVFSMKVTMGPYEVSGSGRSKKLAKQDASQLLMAQVTGNEAADIMGLPGFAGNCSQTSQSGRTSEEYGPQLPQAPNQTTVSTGQSGVDNPISVLDHIVKKHKLGEPEYISVCENGPLALQRFDIKVKVNNMEASGLGRSKKVAKRNAAQAMLDQLSKTKTGIQPPKKRIMFVKASSDTATETGSATDVS